MAQTLRSAETGYQYKITSELAILTCCSCFMQFGIDTEFQKRRRDDHEWFYCPNGHPQHYSQDNEAEKLRKEKLRLEARLTNARDQLEAAESDAKYQRRIAAAAKGRVTKMKNRIANGVCPAPGCKRSGLGDDVIAHIKSCHPQFVIVDE